MCCATAVGRYGWLVIAVVCICPSAPAAPPAVAGSQRSATGSTGSARQLETRKRPCSDRLFRCFLHSVPVDLRNTNWCAWWRRLPPRAQELAATKLIQLGPDEKKSADDFWLAFARVDRHARLIAVSAGIGGRAASRIQQKSAHERHMLLIALELSGLCGRHRAEKLPDDTGWPDLLEPDASSAPIASPSRNRESTTPSIPTAPSEDGPRFCAA